MHKNNELPVDYTKLAPHERRRVREEYVRRQNDKCCHCGAPLSGEPTEKIKGMWINNRLFPPSFFSWPVHLHHNHNTGMTIGAVHNRCNAVLWQYHRK